MRRLLLIILTLGLVSAVAVSAALASVSARPAAAALTLCPETTGVGIPCCGPPTAVSSDSTCCDQMNCCPAAPTAAQIATACCVTCAVPTLTITASPNPSVTGAPVTISGVLSGGAQDTITLWQKLPGGSEFQQLATTMAGATGGYSFALANVGTDRAWYVTGALLQSVTVTQQVSAKLTVKASHRRIRAGSTVRLSGTVAPSQRGASVLLLQRSGGAWKLLTRTRLSAASGFAIRHRIVNAGAVALRVELPGSSDNLPSFSPVITVTATARR
jgi:hypothetical protein